MSEANTRAIRLTRPFRIKIVASLLLLVFLSLTVSGVLVYFTSTQELGKSFFSAHRDLRAVWKGLLPMILAVSAAMGGIACLLALLGYRSFKRSLEASGGELMRTVEFLGRGKLNIDAAPAESGHLRPAVEAASRSVESLRQHVEEIKRASSEIQRTVQRLNYLSQEEGDVTLKDLRALSTNLNTLSREMVNALKWFET